MTPRLTPLVVVWGGDHQEAHGQHHLGVEFVSGHELKSWLRSNVATGNAFNDSQALALLGELSLSDTCGPLTATPFRPLSVYSMACVSPSPRKRLADPEWV